MNWAWAASLDHIWRSPSFPMGLTLAAAGFFALILLLTLLRAEKSVANGALTVITLLAIAIAVAATLRGFSSERAPAPEMAMAITQAAGPSTPALACVDDIAGDAVLSACEKVLFGSPDNVAAAVSYAAGRLSQLQAFGDVNAANRRMTPDLEALRGSVERDRYGLYAYLLTERDHCQPADCSVYRSVTDHSRLASNMGDHVYEGLVVRYGATWSASAPAAAAASVAATIPGLTPSVPTGKPTNADFPTAASIPPVNIMTPEPAAKPASEQAAKPPPAEAKPAPAHAAKRAAPRPKPTAPPTRLTPPRSEN